MIENNIHGLQILPQKMVNKSHFTLFCIVYNYLYMHDSLSSEVVIEILFVI